METYYLLVFTTRIQWKPPNRFPIEFGGAKVWQHRHFIFKIRFPTAAIFADSIHIYIYISGLSMNYPSKFPNFIDFRSKNGTLIVIRLLVQLLVQLQLLQLLLSGPCHQDSKV